MTLHSIIGKAVATTFPIWVGVAQASIVCDQFLVDRARDGKLSVLAFVPVSASGATADAKLADRQIFQYNLKNKLQSFASEIRRTASLQ